MQEGIHAGDPVAQVLGLQERQRQEQHFAESLSSRPHEDLCMMVAKMHFDAVDLRHRVAGMQATLTVMLASSKEATAWMTEQNNRLAELTAHVEGLYAREQGIVQ